MAFRSYPFPPETPLFPVADKVHQYFKDFSHHFSLRQHIKLSTSVTSVAYTPDKPRRWLIQTSTNESYYFDLIMICSGHHRVPRYPSTPGLSEWKVAQKVSHSVCYRYPLPIYKGKTLLIVGSGPSGHDLALDLNGYASKVILSGSNLNNSVDSNGIHFRTRLLSFGSPTFGIVTFADGTVEEGIDYCILATGYIFDLPFLQPPLIHSMHPPQSQPQHVYNASYGIFPLAQHLWPLQTHFPPETMAFIGLITRGTPPPLFETQIRAALRAFDTYTKGIENGTRMRGIDEQTEMTEFRQRWERLRARFGDDESVIKAWHRLDEPETYDYRDNLSIFAEVDPFRDSGSTEVTGQANQNSIHSWNCPSDAPNGFLDPGIDILNLVVRVHAWERFGYTEKDILRKTWVKLEQSGESEKWLKDVGTKGMNDWVDLMYRVAQYGNALEADK